jgi:hypothetical protein
MKSESRTVFGDHPSAPVTGMPSNAFLRRAAIAAATLALAASLGGCGLFCVAAGNSDGGVAGGCGTRIRF